MVVVDAAIIVDFLLDLSADARFVRDRLREESLPWAAPELLDAEVAHVIRRRVLRGELSSSGGLTALADLTAMAIERHSHRPLLQRAFALRDNATVYDALYIALAEALEVPLLTRDAALARVPGVAIPVEVIAPVG
jgi:predicted nucleic acid-binding protein